MKAADGVPERAPVPRDDVDHGHQVFTESGEWYVPDGVTSFTVYLWGAGGGGGGGSGGYTFKGNGWDGASGRAGQPGGYGTLTVLSDEQGDIRGGRGSRIRWRQCHDAHPRTPSQDVRPLRRKENGADRDGK
ncbi:MAG TPA: hypothetical protein VFG87_17280 [Amycolatopsis sp.]|nr:hypothetical protein [Amycolatopsis sp.]